MLGIGDWRLSRKTYEMRDRKTLARYGNFLVYVLTQIREEKPCPVEADSGCGDETTGVGTVYVADGLLKITYVPKTL